METGHACRAVVPSLTSPDSSSEAPEAASVLKSDPAHIQNQIPFQRDSSITKPDNSALSVSLRQSEVLDGPADGKEGKQSARADPSRDSIDGHSSCSLPKSLSARSGKSVKSVAAVGTYHFGSLRVLSNDNNNSKYPAPECLLSGDVVVVTGMPPGSFLGIDTISFTLGKDSHFEGVKDLPPGPHFIYGGSSSELSTRNGFWIMSERRASGVHGEVFVKRWDRYSETLEDELSTAEVRIQKENVPNIFNGLMPYATRASPSGVSLIASQKSLFYTKDMGAKDPQMWNCLTFAIKGAMLNRITSQAWNKWHVSSTQESKSMEMKPIDTKLNTMLDIASDRVEQMTRSDQVLSFAFPRTGMTFSLQVIGRARTEQALDTSSHVLSIIHEKCTYGDSDEVIGELQFCYVTGVLLGNMTCQEQWAHVVKVMFKAFQLAMNEPEFFQKVVETFHSQLIYDEEGIEGSIFDHDASLEDELKIILTTFKSRLIEQLLAKGSDLTEQQNEVGKAFESLESWLWKWGWDLRGNYVRSGKIQLEDGEIVDAELKEFEAEDERGEHAPVIVDLDEDGYEMGLIRW